MFLHFDLLSMDVNAIVLVDLSMNSYHCLRRPVPVLAESFHGVLSNAILIAAVNVYGKTCEWKHQKFICSPIT